MLHKQVDYMCLNEISRQKISIELAKGVKMKTKGRFGVRLACSSDKFNFPLERQSRFTPEPPPSPPPSFYPSMCVTNGACLLAAAIKQKS